MGATLKCEKKKSPASHRPRGLAPVQGDVAAGEERSLTPREDKGIVMGLIGWDGVLG